MIQQAARSNYSEAQADIKLDYDKRAKSIEFQCGDLVLVRIMKGQRGVCAKFADKFMGPYEVMSQVSPVNYVLKSLDTNKTDVYHVNRLKMCSIPENPSWLAVYVCFKKKGKLGGVFQL